ncbi:MAG: aspartate/tyrosine/aromatic aminotransferase [Sphingobacterium sp.]|nr:aspartate/tyrosine/aromatic aminotransferase [Sphingobacterium sp.]
MVSNHTQWLLQTILGDHEFIWDFLNAQRHALTKGYNVVVDMLKKLNIPIVPSYGSLFVWADFSRFLETETFTKSLYLTAIAYFIISVLFILKKKTDCFIFCITLFQ